MIYSEHVVACLSVQTKRVYLFCVRVRKIPELIKSKQFQALVLSTCLVYLMMNGDFEIKLELIIIFSYPSVLTRPSYEIRSTIYSVGIENRIHCGDFFHDSEVEFSRLNSVQPQNEAE